MNFSDFSQGMKLETINLDTLLASHEIDDKLKSELFDLKIKSNPQDKFLYYCSEPKDWAVGMGSEGYVLVRNDIIIESILLRMN